MEKDAIKVKFIDNFEKAFSNFDKTRLVDLYAGFSLRGTYPSYIISNLKISENKIYLPFFYFYLDNEVLDKGRYIDGDKIPLVVKVDFLLLSEDFFEEGKLAYYLNNKFVQSKKHIPINFYTNDEYFYDFKSDKFYRLLKDGYKELQLQDIYDQIMRLHIASYTTCVGLRARIKIFVMRQIPTSIINIVSTFFGVLHWFIIGSIYSYDPIMAQIEDKLKKEAKTPELPKDNDEITFFGYKVKSWTLGSYAFLVLSFFFVSMYLLENIPEPIRIIFKNNFLVLLFAILTMLIYDKILPNLFVLVIKRIKDFSLEALSKEIKLQI